MSKSRAVPWLLPSLTISVFCLGLAEFADDREDGDEGDRKIEGSLSPIGNHAYSHSPGRKNLSIGLKTACLLTYSFILSQMQKGLDPIPWRVFRASFDHRPHDSPDLGEPFLWRSVWSALSNTSRASESTLPSAR